MIWRRENEHTCSLFKTEGDLAKQDKASWSDTKNISKIKPKKMYESVRFISVPLYHCKSVKSKILPLNANIILPYLKNKNKPYFQQINTFLHS